MVHCVKNVGGPRFSNGYDCSAHLAFKHEIVPSGHKAGSIYEGLHFRADITEIGRRAENDPVGLDHLPYTFIRDIILYGTLLILVFPALVACYAAVDSRSRKLHEFRFDALVFDSEST